jgi:hypothetical protein
MLWPFWNFAGLMGWYIDIGQPGRFAALMEMAQKKPPKRDHSKPFGLTWYKSLIQVCVYGSVVFVPIAFAAMDAPVMRGIQCGLLILIFTEPLNNINERFWKSTKISDAEVCITAGMQGQCMFAEGLEGCESEQEVRIPDFRYVEWFSHNHHAGKNDEDPRRRRIRCQGSDEGALRPP